MRTIESLLKVKGSHVWSIAPDAPVYQALELMAMKDIGALVVLEGERVVGILSERDYARKVILRGKASKDTPVRQIMTPDVVFVRPDETVEEGMALMSARHIRHLPVVQSGRLVGMVSIGDLVNTIIADQKVLIGRLEDHILRGVRMS